MNEKLKQKLEEILASLPEWYIIISWGLAFGLAVYYFIVIPILKYDISSAKSNKASFLQQIGVSNLTLSEKAFYLETYEPLYQQLIQGLQSDMHLLTPQQFGMYEQILVVPPFILLWILLLIS